MHTHHQGRWVVHGELTLYDNPWVPLAKVRDLVADGRAQSSGTPVALLHLLAS